MSATSEAINPNEEFDIRDFHHHVLKDGAITLPMLRNNILDWVETKDAP